MRSSLEDLSSFSGGPYDSIDLIVSITVYHEVLKWGSLKMDDDGDNPLEGHSDRMRSGERFRVKSSVDKGLRRDWGVVVLTKSTGRKRVNICSTC